MSALTPLSNDSFQCRKTLSVEHPTGEFSVALEIDPKNPQNVLSAALLRTARLIMRGEVMVPAALYR